MIPLPRRGLPLPYWMRRDDAVRHQKVDQALPELEMALGQQEASEASSSVLGLFVAVLAGLGLWWGSQR